MQFFTFIICTLLPLSLQEILMDFAKKYHFNENQLQKVAQFQFTDALKVYKRIFSNFPQYMEVNHPFEFQAIATSLNIRLPVYTSTLHDSNRLVIYNPFGFHVVSPIYTIESDTKSLDVLKILTHLEPEQRPENIRLFQPFSYTNYYAQVFKDVTLASPLEKYPPSDKLKTTKGNMYSVSQIICNNFLFCPQLEPIMSQSFLHSLLSYYTYSKEETDCHARRGRG
jgi:hypothetical protein